jgi:hypothetical protein
MEELSPKDLLLRDFKWWGNLRPLTKNDVFR